MTPALLRWNGLPADRAVSEILSCCASGGWARCLAAGRPFADEATLLRAADACWAATTEDDKRAAYDAHPRIGARVSGVAAAEQSGVGGASDATLASLARANQEYEARFGRVFLVCATGRSAEEMLALCRQRLQNDPRVELSISAEEQRKITALRITRWLAERP